MKGSGIRGVVGRSFARIFCCNCVNLGLAIVACPAAADAAHDGSRITIDTTGAVEVDGVAFEAPAAPPLRSGRQAVSGAGPRPGSAGKAARWSLSAPGRLRALRCLAAASTGRRA